MANGRITDRVNDMIADFLAENGYELWDMRYVKEGREHYLRIFIDRADGDYISTEDCEKVSRFVSDELDRYDPIEDNYFLEVSSPGMDRELTRREHFDRCAGQIVEVRLYKPLNGEKLIEGELLEATEKEITIRIEEGGQVTIPRSQTAKISLAVIF